MQTIDRHNIRRPDLSQRSACLLATVLLLISALHLYKKEVLFYEET